MQMQVTPDNEGYNQVLENIPFRRRMNDSLHGTRYPDCYVTATIEHERGTDSGTVLHIGSSTDSTTEHGVTEYNGFFLKIQQNSGEGHGNVYADQGTGGPHYLSVDDWEGLGARVYKYPIESITIEIDESKDPQCRCGKTMVFGFSEETDNSVIDSDGSRGRWVAGWMCPECFPGKIREREQLP